MQFVNCGIHFPDDWNEKIIRVISTKEIIAMENLKAAEADYFLMEDDRTIYYSQCEWLDESIKTYTEDEVVELLKEAYKEGFSQNGRPLGEWGDNLEENEENLKEWITAKLKQLTNNLK